MNGLLQTQEELQQGSKKINAMLQEMDDKTVSGANMCARVVFIYL